MKVVQTYLSELRYSIRCTSIKESKLKLLLSLLSASPPLLKKKEKKELTSFHSGRPPGGVIPIVVAFPSPIF